MEAGYNRNGNSLTEMNGDCPNDDGDNNERIETKPLHFISTQVQSNLEMWEEEGRRSSSIGKTISHLQRFQHANIAENSGDEVAKSKVIEPSRRPTERKTRTSARKKVERKIKSITSHMTEKYNAEKRHIADEQLISSAKGREQYVQLSILKLLSGKKKKVSDILRRIENIEQKRNEQKNSQGNSPRYLTEDESEDPYGGILYSRDDWINIVKSIKLTFPNLSKSAKRSLASINKKMVESATANSQSLWSSACAPPSTDFTDEDIKWLYDLNDQEMIRSFVTEGSVVEDEEPMIFTLSQLMDECDSKTKYKEHSQSNNENPDEILEIPYSSPSLSPIVVMSSDSVESYRDEKVVSIHSKRSSRREDSPKSVRENDVIDNDVNSYDFRNVNDEENGKMETNEGSDSFSYVNDTYFNEPIDQLDLCEELKLTVTPKFFVSSSSSSPEIKGKSCDTSSRQKDYDFNGFEESRDLASQYNFSAEEIDDSVEELDVLDFRDLRSSRKTVFEDFKGTQDKPIDLDLYSSDQSKSDFPNSIALNAISKSKTLANTVVSFSATPKQLKFNSNSRSDSPTTPSKFNEIISNDDEEEETHLGAGTFDESKQIGSNHSSPISDVKDSPVRSIYSTARSQVYHSLPQHVRKRYKTSVVEVKGRIGMHLLSPTIDGASVTKVKTNKVVYDVDEIPDSDDQMDGDVSLVEIIRAIDDGDAISQKVGNEHGPSDVCSPLRSAIEKFNHFVTSPVVQVPSSSGLNSVDTSPIKRSNKQNSADKDVSSFRESVTTNSNLHLSESMISELAQTRPFTSPIRERESQKVEEDFDFTLLTTKELRQKMVDWALKPVKTRLKMIEILTETNKAINHEDIKSQTHLPQKLFAEMSHLPLISQQADHDLEGASTQDSRPNIVRTNISNNITKLVEKNDFWYEKILSFEPLMIEDFVLFLHNNGMKLEQDIIKKYFDDLGICYTLREQSGK